MPDTNATSDAEVADTATLSDTASADVDRAKPKGNSGSILFAVLASLAGVPVLLGLLFHRPVVVEENIGIFADRKTMIVDAADAARGARVPGAFEMGGTVVEVQTGLWALCMIGAIASIAVAWVQFTR